MKLPLPLRIVGRTLDRLHPELAARWTEQVFLTVPKFKAPRREAEWTRTAERIELDHACLEQAGATLPEHRGPLRGWSWGVGPLVLLVHGWGGRASQMGALGTTLARAGFRAVAFDAPGHGDSRGFQSSLPAMAETLLAAEAQLGPAAGYVTHSLGTAALLMAQRAGLADRPAVLLAAPADLEFFLGDVARAVGVSNEVAQMMRRRVEGRFRISWRELRPAALVRWVGEAPLLVLSDAADPEVPCSHGEAIAAGRPAARLERTVGLGHRRILRDPGVTERCADFLQAALRKAPADRQPQHARA